LNLNLFGLFSLVVVVNSSIFLLLNSPQVASPMGKATNLSSEHHGY